MLYMRHYYQLNVPRALVYTVMEDVGSHCLEYRTVGEKAKEKREVLHLKEAIGCFFLMVMISSWSSKTVSSRLQYTRLSKYN